MISVRDAHNRIIRSLTAVDTEMVALSQAYGRVLAENSSARRTQPPRALSAMDGYAVRAADIALLPKSLTVVGQSRAGCEFDGTVGQNETVRIFTGALMPLDADTVIVQEDVELVEDIVIVRKIPQRFGRGRHVREAGVDFQNGEQCLRAGQRLSARHIGLAASMNRPWLTVFRRPRVAILATGDELVLPGDLIGPNQIVDVNSFAVEALVRGAGCTPVRLGIALDNPSELAALAQRAKSVDLLVTIGGASVGDHDLVKEVLNTLGLELGFWQIAMRPGKPLIWGRLGTTHVLGLPGNPVAALICSLLFLRPALDRLQGLPGDQPLLQEAFAGHDLPATGVQAHYLHAHLVAKAGKLFAFSSAIQDTSVMSSFADSDCLIVRAPQSRIAREGEQIRIICTRENSYTL